MTVVPTEEMRRALEGLGFERLSVMGRGVDAALFDPAKIGRASCRERVYVLV